MANISGASLQPIYQRLNDAPTYHPLEADTFSDWSMEAGDIITVERDGKSYQSPVHQSTVKWNRGQQISISSTGNREREPVAKTSRKRYSGGSGALRDSMYKSLLVQDTYNQLVSGLEVTASEARLYVDNRYAQMQSGLRLTASEARLYVDNKYAQMQSGLRLTSSSAMLYAYNRTTRAFIITRINADGEGETLIEADKIKLSGTTTINNVFTVIEDAVGVRVPMICNGNVDISSNKVLNLYTATFQGSNPVTLTALDLMGVIRKASVSGNTLTLTPFIGDAITFSKATSLSGEWSSGHLEVTARPQNSKYHQYIISGDAEDTSSDNNSWYVPILAKNDPNSQSSSRTGHRVYVNATARYNAGKTQGYNDAANDMSWPSQISGQNDKTTVNIRYPTTSGSSSTRTLKLTKDSAGAYLQLGNTLIMKISL